MHSQIKSGNIKKLMLSHLIQTRPWATPCGLTKSLAECFQKVDIDGREQWVLWYNNESGSTHMFLEDMYKEESK